MRITFEGWDPVDRQLVRGTLVGLDRAQTQAADLNPAALRPGGVGGVRVGACAWDGAYVLAAALDAQPPGSFAGLRAVELGAGMGLPGLVLARLGAAVWLTDKPAATVFGRCNAAKNRMLVPSAPAPSPLPPTQQQRQQQAPAPGSVAVLGLDWEDGPGAAAAAATITAAGPVDLIVGTDCIYPDPDGSVPDSSALLATVCALATPGRTRALLSFEARSDALRRALLDAASAAPLACRVRMLPPETLPEAYRAPHIELYELSF
ncbi:lysine methyltransferase METTL21D [Micractinium conductrix]|uniref:Lysine methyltransferase METTL21D n=1 Tax=Micractinium conductrix TaxID=554055 RepID=A0A2P6VA33_9CHLO|nr:lysine methyltransferase METTL21D [Micractinium conductrix]|eukprot:PSC70949.1 lysine methyltransferase METTL21D [Micractinium conductrix]